jgi:hypothetical protein
VTEAARLQTAIRALERIVEGDGPSQFVMCSLASLRGFAPMKLYQSSRRALARSV